MPNTIDLMQLICARCDETRPHKFNKTYEGCVMELTPINGVQPVYLCKDCRAEAKKRPESSRLAAQYIQAMEGRLGTNAETGLILKRYTQAKSRGV